MRIVWNLVSATCDYLMKNDSYYCTQTCDYIKHWKKDKKLFHRWCFRISAKHKNIQNIPNGTYGSNNYYEETQPCAYFLTCQSPSQVFGVKYAVVYGRVGTFARRKLKIVVSFRELEKVTCPETKLSSFNLISVNGQVPSVMVHLTWHEEGLAACYMD